MKKVVFTLAFLVIASAAFTQKKPDKEFRKKYIEAVEYMQQPYRENPYREPGNYQKAIPILLELDSIWPNNANLQFKLGVCYLNSFYENIRAAAFLEKAVMNVSPNYTGDYKDSTASPFAYYYLGIVYRVDYRLNEAIEQFNKFKANVPEDKPELLAMADRQINMVKTAIRLMKQPLEIKVEHLGSRINTSYPDYCPVVSVDQKTIYFCSRREGSTGGETNLEGNYFEDIYVADLSSDVSKDGVIVHSLGFNTNGHEAPISISLDGQYLFIYKDDKGDGNIYVTEHSKGEWAEPVKLNENINSSGWETHACLSPDGERLYFVSDRKGGYGKRDIYYCDLNEEGEWGEAHNCGPMINTPHDEESPFILADGITLYFSSDGHETMGGFDVFTSVLIDDTTWSMPKNLGYPINTTDDDVFFVPTHDERQAYWSSAKVGGYGEKDIYRLTIMGMRKEVTFKGNVFDEVSNLPIQAKILIRDNKTGEIVKTVISDSITGEFATTLEKGRKYDLCISARNYAPSCAQIQLLDNHDRIIYINKDKTVFVQGFVYDAVTKVPVSGRVIVTDPVSGMVIETAVSQSLDGSYRIPVKKGRSYDLHVKAANYIPYFEFVDVKGDVNKVIYLNKGTTAKLSGKVLDKETTMPVSAKVEVLDPSTGEVVGATSSFPENGEYSLNIATGKAYVLNVTALGYEPYSENISPNENVNRTVFLEKGQTITFSGNVLDNDTKLPLGATVEIIDPASERIVAYVNSEAETGEFSIILPLNKKYDLLVEAWEYKPYKGSITTEKNLEKIVYLSKRPYQVVEVNKTYVLPEILYDFDKYNIKPQYADSLDDLIYTMTHNPTIVVELSSHTDYRATDEYNYKLSYNRAKSAVDYLIARGIEADRLIAKGYGEKVPRTLKKNMRRDGFLFTKGTVLTPAYIDALSTEAEREAAHQLNRRTEFKVIRDDYFPQMGGTKSKLVPIDVIKAGSGSAKPQTQTNVKTGNINENVSNVTTSQGYSTAEPKGKDGIIFRVQIGTSLENDKKDFFLNSGIEGPLFVFQDGNFYKYAVGEFKTFEEALSRSNQIRETTELLPFVIAFQHGVRISALKAKAILEK